MRPFCLSWTKFIAAWVRNNDLFSTLAASRETKWTQTFYFHDFSYQMKHGTIDLSMYHLVEILKQIAIKLWFLIFKVMRITFASVLSRSNKIHCSFREKQWLIFNPRRFAALAENVIVSHSSCNEFCSRETKWTQTFYFPYFKLGSDAKQYETISFFKRNTQIDW